MTGVYRRWFVLDRENMTQCDFWDLWMSFFVFAKILIMSHFLENILFDFNFTVCLCFGYPCPSTTKLRNSYYLPWNISGHNNYTLQNSISQTKSKFFHLITSTFILMLLKFLISKKKVKNDKNCPNFIK